METRDIKVSSKLCHGEERIPAEALTDQTRPIASRVSFDILHGLGDRLSVLIGDCQELQVAILTCTAVEAPQMTSPVPHGLLDPLDTRQSKR